MLAVDAVSTAYGAVEALREVSISVTQGEIVTLVGANGAGKSTLLMTICGDPRARSGRVVFEDRDITALPTHEIMRLGLAQVPEGRRVFPRMSVMENLLMGAQVAGHDPAPLLDQVFALFPRLKERQAQRGGTLSGGEQQMLAIGRALMSKPRLLLLDEPTAGVSPIVMDELFDRIIEIARTGIAILMVEQNARQALNIADKGYVLVQGANRYTDTGAALMANPEVRRTFLGG